MNSSYSSLAPYYDLLNGGTDYGEIFSFCREEFQKNPKKILSVLDLACGTGTLSVRFAENGYDVTALDLSEEMLSLARNKAGNLPILFSRQNMASFELFGSVDAVVCALDSVNYLLKKDEVASAFSRVANYLEPGGLFIFDLNTPFRLEKVFGGQDFVLEEEGVLCTWRNTFREKDRVCTFDLDFFLEQPDGSYLRESESQKERAYSLKTVTSLLEENHLSLLSLFGSYAREPVTPESEKWVFVCRRQ